MGHWAWMHFGYWDGGESHPQFRRGAGIRIGSGRSWRRSRPCRSCGACSPRAYMAKVMRLRGCGAIAWGTQIGGRLNPRLGTVYITHPEHKRSIRGADKCGFKAVQQRTYKGSQRFCLRGRSWVQVGLKSHAYSDPFGATDFKVCRRQPSRQAAGRVESPLNTYRKRGVGGAAKPGHSKSKSPAADMRNGRDGGTNHSETGAY